MTDYITWNAGYNAALKAADKAGFVSRHDHQFFDGTDVGMWIGRQHDNFPSQGLSPARKAMLRVLPGGSPDQVAHEGWAEKWPALRRALLKHGVQMTDKVKASRTFQNIMEGIDPFSIACQHLCFNVAGFSGNPNDEVRWMRTLAAAIAAGDMKWLATQVDLSDNYKLHEWRRRALLKHTPKKMMDLIRWDQKYSLLFKYILSTGESLPPADYDAEGFAVGEFAHQMRAELKKDQLSPEHRLALAGLPGWSNYSAKPAQTSTRTMCAAFLDAMDTGRFDPATVSIRQWVQEARFAMNAGSLPERQQLILQATPGFSWLKRSNNVSEHAMIVARIIEAEGEFSCHPWTMAEGVNIGAWWGYVQSPAEERQVTKHVNVDKTKPALRGEALWNHLFGVLAHYVDTNEGELPGIDVVVDGIPLGCWAWTVNYLASQSLLPVQHIVALQEATAYCGWVDAYGQVCAAYENGSPRKLTAPARRWVAQVRRWYFLGVENQQVELLGQIPGFTWGTEKDRLFKERAQSLRQLVKATDGGLKHLATVDFVDGFSPSAFIMTQRQRYLNPGLPGWKVEMLESIPGWRWANETLASKKPSTGQWLTLLEQWQADFGPIIPDRTVVFQGESLGGWVETMRQRHAVFALPGKVADRLEQFPGWTWEPTAPHALAHGLL